MLSSPGGSVERFLKMSKKIREIQQKDTKRGKTPKTIHKQANRQNDRRKALKSMEDHKKEKKPPNVVLSEM